jgi:phosphoesterase RecJ-like protein
VLRILKYHFENSSYSDCNYWWANLKVISKHHTAYTTLTQDELNTFDYVKEILKA